MLALAWGEWLSGFDWEWWCTLTFREAYSPEAANRAFGRWVDRIGREGQGRPSYFMAHEVGRLGRLHLHALLGQTRRASRRVAFNDWHARHGRAQILPYLKARGANFYIAKYTAKQLGDWDIYWPDQKVLL